MDIDIHSIRNPRRSRCPALAAIVMLLGCIPVLAHHSFAMFDGNKETKLVGTVKQFLWANPHVFVELLVPDASGAQKVWSLQMNGIAGYARKGWTRDTIKPGEHV